MLQLNEQILKSVLMDFYTLTKIQIVLIDGDFNEILRYPEQRISFCSMIRKNVKYNTDCAICDKNACIKCSETKRLVTYRCHMGLSEAVVPIYDKHGTMGYIMFGQIVPADSAEEVITQLKEWFSEQSFSGITQAIDAISIKTQAEINAAATILQALTTYVLTNKWVIPQKSDFIRKLDAYIAENLSCNITIDDLCGEFRMGRTSLYDISAAYLGCGLAEYVREKRIEHAQRMLLDTDATVTEIAFATGFSDYNHFSRVFRLITGMSARHYRQASRLHPDNEESEQA